MTEHSIPTWVKELGINGESIDSDIRACKGFGYIYENEAENEHIQSEMRRKHAYAISATNFRRAAAHFLLIGVRFAPGIYFGQAAENYAKLQVPYAFMMAALSRDETPHFLQNLNYGQLLEHSGKASYEIDPQAIYPLLFYSSKYKRDRLSSESWMRIREELEAYRSYPIGILGIPIGSYLDLADYLNYQILDGISPEEALLPFLERYNTAIRQTIQNKYHWQRLSFPFHPAEPDILSVLILVELAIKREPAMIRKKQSLLGILENFPLAQESHLILRKVLNQLFNDLAS